MKTDWKFPEILESCKLSQEISSSLDIYPVPDKSFLGIILHGKKRRVYNFFTSFPTLWYNCALKTFIVNALVCLIFTKPFNTLFFEDIH